MKNNNTFTCAICGKEYDSVAERSNCENKCIREVEVAEALRKLNEEKKMRTQSEEDIAEILSKADDMIAKHLEDFGTLKLRHTYHYLSHVFKRVSMWF